MPLIAEVTKAIGDLFLEFRKFHYDWNTDETYKDYRLKLMRRMQEVESWSVAQREEFTLKCQEDLRELERINTGIAEQLDRLTPDTFPLNDPAAPGEMLGLLLHISDCYRPVAAKKGASFVAVMLYLFSCGIDHAAWYASTWLACSLSTHRWTLAETIIKSIGEEKGVRGPFAKDPEQRVWMPLSRSLISLQRDGEVEKALEYAEHARDNCATSDLAVQYCNGLKAAHKAGALDHRGDLEVQGLLACHITPDKAALSLTHTGDDYVRAPQSS